MFAIGETVCYPTHGMGVIESVSEQSVCGKTERYYHIRFFNNRIIAMVPVDNAPAVGLRLPATLEECERALALLREDTVRREDPNWNRRYHDNMELLRKGDILSVTAVVKSLSQREARKGLSSGEKRMLTVAARVLTEEMIFVTGKEEEALLKEMGGA